MTLFKSLLLGSAAGIVAIAGASAADLPSKKAAPATYVKICDAYGAGFFYIPGTDTCVKVGGYVRVDYDYRPARKNTTAPNNATTASDSTHAPTYITNTAVTDTSTSGFYNRGTVQLDARTPTSMGVARTFMALREETGSGPQAKSGSQPSLEAAFVQWAGFTAGQAAQPFSFMSSWAYNTQYWTGWPSGVRQLTYTGVLGGGFSVTAGITDAHNYNTVSTAAKDLTNGVAAKTEGLDTPGYNGIIYVGNVRYDQAWGSVQVMGAAHTGGDLSSGPAVQDGTVYGGNTTATSGVGTKKSGYAVGAGVAINLPMLAAGDRIELTAVYAQRLSNFLADAGVNNPSSAAYGTNPIGGPGVAFNDANGISVGAQLRHYWTSELRSQFYASYTTRKMNDSVATTNNGTTQALASVGGAAGALVGASANAYGLGTALIYSPAKDFDIGLELNYLRGSWNQIAAASKFGALATAGVSASNLVSKLRIQRNF